MESKAGLFFMAKKAVFFLIEISSVKGWPLFFPFIGGQM